MVPVRLEDDSLEPVLCIPLCDPPKQREAASLAVHGELAGREADVLAFAVAALPDGEADELQPVEFPAGEVDLRVGELARGGVTVRLENLES